MMAVAMILAEWYVSVLVTALYGPSIIIPWMIVAQLFFMMLFFYLPFEYINIQAMENEREEVKHLIIHDDEETLVGDFDYDCGQKTYAESLSSFGYEGDDVCTYGTMASRSYLALGIPCLFKKGVRLPHVAGVCL